MLMLLLFVVCHYDVILNVLDGQKLWIWGRNCEGQLGLGDSRVFEACPYFFTFSPFSVTSVCAFGWNTFLVSSKKMVLFKFVEEGDVYGCGTNDLGQLGLGTICTQKSKFVSIPRSRVVSFGSGCYSDSSFVGIT